MAPETPKKEGPVPTPQEAFLFMYVTKHNKNATMDVDWDAVAQDASLKNGKSARARFYQIRQKLGFGNETGSPSPTSKPVGVTKKTLTPKTPRGKDKNKTVAKTESGSHDGKDGQDGPKDQESHESHEVYSENPFKIDPEQEEENIFANQ